MLLESLGGQVRRLGQQVITLVIWVHEDWSAAWVHQGSPGAWIYWVRSVILVCRFGPGPRSLLADLYSRSTEANQDPEVTGLDYKAMSSTGMG